jgi:hypothetical protein
MERNKKDSFEGCLKCSNGKVDEAAQSRGITNIRITYTSKPVPPKKMEIAKMARIIAASQPK